MVRTGVEADGDPAAFSDVRPHHVLQKRREDEKHARARLHLSVVRKRPHVTTWVKVLEHPARVRVHACACVCVRACVRAQQPRTIMAHGHNPMMSDVVLTHIVNLRHQPRIIVCSIT